MMQTSLNDAIAIALEKKWGFHYRHFIPREIIAMYRKEASQHYPQLLKVEEFHIEAVHKLIERAGLDVNLFSLITPVYSGKFDDKGKLHIYKAKNCFDRRGDIQIGSSTHLNEFMSSVIHDDWQQEIGNGEFQFLREDLKYLPDNLPYQLY